MHLEATKLRSLQPPKSTYQTINQFPSSFGFFRSAPPSTENFSTSRTAFRISSLDAPDSTFSRRFALARDFGPSTIEKASLVAKLASRTKRHARRKQESIMVNSLSGEISRVWFPTNGTSCCSAAEITDRECRELFCHQRCERQLESQITVFSISFVCSIIRV